ncbi:MAG: BatD family protein [Planctomycetaceae bacterium]|nr:BatD family protein [Planctomycetales bacterium]MCB9921784.1 BatD family protein [Planctomycetaceae bacterium]
MRNQGVDNTLALSISRRGARILVALFAGFLFVAPVDAQDGEVIVELDRERIYEGESVRYRVFLSRFDQPAEPELVGFDAFVVQQAGTQQVNSSSIRIINGRRQQVTRRGIIYEYLLTPQKTGQIPIPAPIVKVDGEPVPSKSVTLTVVPAEEQDIAVLDMTSSHTVVYPMQPFDITLKIFIKPIPEPESDHDPLSVQNPLVQLTLPWAEDEALVAGIVPKIPGERWLDAMRNRSGGFSINGRESSRSPFGSFGGFFSDLAEGFRPTPKRVRRADASGRRLEYWEYTLTRTFVANKVGEYSFGPATVKGSFGVRVDTRGQLEGEAAYAFAKPVIVRVKDVPTEGRPESYTGAIGRFEIGADVSPQTAKVGDPVTLTLWLRGQGTLENVLAPKLDGIANFDKHFKIYEATEETRDDSREFTYSLRPKSVDASEIPSIPISYFDVDRESFVTLQTDPIPISVTAADRMASGEIAMATPQSPESASIEARAEGIFANVTDLRELRDETVHPDRWFLSLGALTGLFFIVAMVAQRVQRFQSDTSLQRRRTAAADARRRLRAATSLAEEGDTRRGAEAISEALIGLVADATNTPYGVLTSTDAARRLRELKIADETVRRVQEVMQTCDDARYGAAGEAMKELPNLAEAVLEDLIRAMKKQRLLS